MHSLLTYTYLVTYTAEKAQNSLSSFGQIQTHETIVWVQQAGVDGKVCRAA